MINNGTFFNKVSTDLGARMYKMVSQSGFPQLVVNSFILIAVLAALFFLKEPLALLGLGMLQQVPVFQPMFEGDDPNNPYGTQHTDTDEDDPSIGFTATLKHKN